jgi:hypothetical protein
MVFDDPKAEDQPHKPNLLLFAALGAVLLAVLVLIGFGLRSSRKPQNPVLVNDLGTKRNEAAGIGGRLIAQWKDEASYRLVLDPLEPANLPAFEAIAGNLPHAFVFTITLRDTSGGVACQRQIVLTTSTAVDGTGQAQNPTALATATGDTVQSVAGEDGKIEELVLSGPLPCRLDAFQRIAAWQFSTDFPPLSEQAAGISQPTAAAKAKSDFGQAAGINQPSAAARAKSHSGSRQAKSVNTLPAAIEGDDVIVSDNPSRGIWTTSGGRTFLVGADVEGRRAFGWQLFPAAIHYRCERNATCTLTRLNSGAVVRARLMR